MAGRPVRRTPASGHTAGSSQVLVIFSSQLLVDARLQRRGVFAHAPVAITGTRAARPTPTDAELEVGAGLYGSRPGEVTLLPRQLDDAHPLRPCPLQGPALKF